MKASMILAAPAFGAPAADSQVDENGIGTMGRKGLSFSPQTARDQLFGFIPERQRKFVFPGVILFIILLISAIGKWLDRQGRAH